MSEQPPATQREKTILTGIAAMIGSAILRMWAALPILCCVGVGVVVFIVGLWVAA